MNMFLEDPMPSGLRARLTRLSETAATIQPPASVEAQLVARLFDSAANAVPAHAVAASSKATRRTPTWIERWGAWLAWPVSVTAAAGLVSWMVYTNPAIAPEQIEPATPSYEVAGGATAATPFMALTSLDNIPPGSQSEVVSATLPRATLAEFGLPVSPMRAAEPIQAEFLVGANGGVLAVRFVESDSGR
jgi:hypothetical protein